MTKRILFVCLGNICRSPTATGVFRARAEAAGLDAHADGAGAGAWHVGEPPDPRAREEAAKRGYDLSALRARQVTALDFGHYDLILAMDRSNLAALERIRPAHARARLALFLDYAPDQPRREVPDPYYEGGFDLALDLIETASDGLIAEIRGG
ncbi:MAG: low molecular weight protein-tyrosine-phosphatase [Pseudomonadota bacterium]